MPALPADIKAKIASLLRLQASDNDGERANASAAITRLLQRYGADWHDLAAVLLSEPQAAPAASATTGAAPASSWKRSAGALDLPRGELLNLIEIIEARTPFLSLNSTSFISSLRQRAWRPVVHLSEKQSKWFQDLLEQTGV
jgi:Protein of unknown function (DUF2786)